MKFAFLFYEAPAGFDARTDENQAGYWGAWQAYATSMAEAGVKEDRCAGAALQPPTAAATVRLRDGKRHVQDGPFADTKEQLGGFVLIDAPSLEEALNWAARCPAAASGAVEVRPVLDLCTAP